MAARRLLTDLRRITAKQLLGIAAVLRRTEPLRSRTSYSPIDWCDSAAVQAGLALDPNFTIRRYRHARSASGDHPRLHKNPKPQCCTCVNNFGSRHRYSADASLSQ